MKTSLFTPIQKCLILRKTFQNKINSKIISQCFREQKLCFNSTKRFQSTHNCIPRILNQNLLDPSKKQVVIFQGRKFSAQNKTRTQLMDLEVAVTPSFLNIISRIFDTFLIKNLDNEFDIREFVTNTKTALAVVTKLLSELKFSELNGLLTNECIAEVEKNVREMPLSQRYGLAVELEDIYFSFPNQTKIIKGGNEGERTYFQVTVVHHVCKNYQSIMKRPPWLVVAESKLEMFTVYNCRFIKEFTKGIDDHWIINGININKLGEDPRYQ